MMKTDKLTISRVSSNRQDDDGQIKIEIISKKELIVVYVTPESFALALTGMARLPCNAKIQYK